MSDVVRRYKVLLPIVVHTDDGGFAQGQVFAKTFDSAEEEHHNLQSGLLELQPLEYRVVGESTVHDTPPGSTFAAAISMAHEELLMAGGHIELVGHPDDAEALSEPLVPNAPAESEKPAAKTSTRSKAKDAPTT